MKGRLISTTSAHREIALGLLRGVLEPLERHGVLAEIDAFGLLEPLDEVLDDPTIEVLAAEEGVARGREHLDHAVLISRIEMSKVPPPRS